FQRRDDEQHRHRDGDGLRKDKPGFAHGNSVETVASSGAADVSIIDDALLVRVGARPSQRVATMRA
ncbi:MAG: hypothetical protein ABI781_16335, partial [Burkholderiales bacterium]